MRGAAVSSFRLSVCAPTGESMMAARSGSFHRWISNPIAAGLTTLVPAIKCSGLLILPGPMVRCSIRQQKARTSEHHHPSNLKEIEMVDQGKENWQRLWSVEDLKKRDLQ